MKTISHLPLKRLAIAAAVALALPLSASAFAGQKGAMYGGCGGMGDQAGFAHPGMGGDGLPRYLYRLNLTEAQRDRIFDIMHAQAPTLRNNMKAVYKARSDLRALTTAPDFSEAKAKELANAAATAMGEMALNRAKTERQVIDVLTPEQRQQLAELKTEAPRRPDNWSRVGMGRNAPVFQDFDLNGDGQITADEFNQAQAKRMSERAAAGFPMRGAASAPSFEAIDADHDGVVTPAEFQSWQEKRRQQMPSRR
ncbi:MAG: Spy/CpxP family protein refolding chaperone [Azonexus sp.]|jgi:Spy/CpxP family protein refolding chaperone|uniref:Spy/CpxP family protein refolding chaperone n=1 Tax=Azonexus sp. TaxID=1872668 RepID=UPI00282885E3|nr:Spy/CpxP family protein refolding chaperone [Azonexus sp.]MDR0776382.1 Spy/CpxP family protein refolding chaperone [Azonexus sp.]